MNAHIEREAPTPHRIHAERPVGPSRLRRAVPRPDAAGREFAYRIVSRTLDVFVSTGLLVLLAPLMGVIAMLIRLDSPGPALFRQARQGRRTPGGEDAGDEDARFGRPFVLYKFRTMFADARDSYPELYRYEHTSEELSTLPIKVLVSRKVSLEQLKQCPELGSGMANDPRITRVGRWLRRTSLDELPNFLSVLRGDMTLVGPRPDILENIRYYSPEHLRKLDVKPGITGLAQIRGRGRLSFLETNDYDLEYVDRRSLRMDLGILLRTIPSVLTRDGAY